MRHPFQIVCLALCAAIFAACTAPAAPRPASAPAPTTVAVASPVIALTAAPTIAPTPTQPPPPSSAGAPTRPVTVSPVGQDGTLVKGTEGLPWWNDSTFYEIFVRSFYDSDGDGKGDLQGLIQKLGYLNDGNPATTSDPSTSSGQDLGVTGLWLMPIMASPSYHGYDVTDYYQVNPEYGTNEDFKRLIDEAHKRGIRVIIDLVLNHTSSEHPWFIESQNPDSAKRDWYVWSDKEPQGKGWHPGVSGGYYYGYFGEHMPDLNYKNPEVTEEMNKVIRFWLEEMGADGFRLDAVKYLYEDGKRIEHTPATHEWLKDFNTFYKGIDPQAFTVGEVWDDSGTAAKYVGDELDATFDFGLAAGMIQSAVGGDRANAEQAAQTTIAAYPPGQFATFLANHDQNRTRSRLLYEEQAKTAATLQLAFGGVPFIYYGEEIGMQGTKPDENIRRPMQWTADGGFTTGTPWNDYFEDYPERNVAGQDADPNSLLNHYRALIRLRSEHEALRVGDWQSVTSGNDAVYAALRSTDGEQILVLVNLGTKPVDEYRLSLAASPLKPGARPALLLGEADLGAGPVVDDAGGFADYKPIAALPPQSSYVIQFAR
jgi:alpha-amylase